MKRERWALIAEIIGALAVVISDGFGTGLRRGTWKATFPLDHLAFPRFKHETAGEGIWQFPEAY